jgi:alkylation response protein AidB-like acyl-CoA dehydrogenase
MTADDWPDALRATASRFAADRLAPFYMARETQERIDRALLREMGGLGLIAPEAPEQFGGLGLSSVASGIVMEAIAYGDFNIAYVQLLGSLLTQIIASHAPEALAQDWVPRILAGEALVAIALTEPRGGTAATIACPARRRPSAARIRPMQCWCSRAPDQRRTARVASAPSWCRPIRRGSRARVSEMSAAASSGAARSSSTMCACRAARAWAGRGRRSAR